jgi:uncharacterized repeat protein (TIGR01451 family)/LPXTG-motif cell wall-anchored protein
MNLRRFTRPRFTPLRLFPLFLTAVFVYLLFMVPQSALAEGSKDLTDGDGYRPYLLWQPGAQTGGVTNSNTFKVYAVAGEVINLGSSAKDIAAGQILYRPPTGGGFVACPAGDGIIQNRAQEIAGPLPAAGGYDPCVVNVGAGQDGVWEVQFVSTDPTDPGNPPLVNLAGGDNWTLPGGQPADVRWIRAFDITVTLGGVPQLGRVYADYLPLNMGSNVPGAPVFSSELYIYSEDGYGYEVDMNGIDPFGFTFLSNNKGFTQGNLPVYQSLMFTGSNPGAFPPGYALQNPATPDDAAGNNYTHKVFFNEPPFALFEAIPGVGSDNIVPSASGPVNFVSPPLQPPVPTLFAFTGIEGTPGQAGTTPLGGTFSFTAPQVVPFTIALDVNANMIYGDANDRVFIGTTVIGNNDVFWDGLDGAGVPVPASVVGYNAIIQLYAGEVHFPFLDAENNPVGIQIERVRDPGTTTNPPDPFTVYYNDTYNYNGTNAYDYSLCAAVDAPPPPPAANIGNPPCKGVPSTPRSAVLGTLSNGGAHEWTTDFGDRAGVDTWAFYPSEALNLPGGVPLLEADLAIEKSHTPEPVSPGGPITFTLVVSNNGPSNAPGARVVDTFPPEMTNVTWTCEITTGTGACSQPGPVSGNIDTLIDLNNGAQATFTINGTVAPTTTAPFSNTAFVFRPNDITDPNDPNRTGAGNNSDTDPVTLGPPVTATSTPTDTPTDGPTATPGQETPTATAGGPTVTVTPPSGTFVPPPDQPDDGQAFINKSVSPPFALPGDPVTWTITITNPASTPATGVTVTDNLPAQLEILSVSASSGTASFNGQTVNFAQPSLAAGGSITITVQTRVRANAAIPFTISNLASLRTNENPDPRTARATLSSVGSLPNTGESPWWAALVWGAGALSLAGVAFWLVRRS